MGLIAHTNIGNELTKAEWEANTTHTIDGVTSVDIVRSATYVIAASDAPAHVRAQADYPGGSEQTAIDTGAKSVKLSEGTFNIAANVSSSTDKMHFSGVGKGTIIKRVSGNDIHMLTFTGDLVTIADLYIHGNRYVDNATVGNNLIVTGITNATIKNVVSNLAPNVGLYDANGDDTVGLVLNNVVLSNAGNHGAYFQKRAGILSTNLNCWSNGSIANGDNLYMLSCLENYFTNTLLDVSYRYNLSLEACQKNTFIGGYWGGSVNTCVVVFGDYSGGLSSGLTIRDVTFNSNATNATGFDIQLNPTTELRDLLIEGNQFIFATGRASTSLDIRGKITRSLICNNTGLGSGYTTPVAFTNYTGNIEFSHNQGYIAPGEIRTYSGTIATLTQNAYNSLDNPFGQAVRLLDLQIYISTGATSTTPNLDCGIGSSATTDYTTLFDDLPGETVGFYKSTITTPGTQTVPILWASGSGNRYLNMSIKDAAATGMVATYIATVMGL